jgi:hypothetical protein
MPLEFIRAILAGWATRMTGPVSVVAALASVFFSNTAARITTAVTAFLCAAYTAYAVWEAQRRKVVALEEKLDPKLNLHFDPEHPSCVSRVPGSATNGMLYVRVLPTCSAQVTGCRGILKRVRELKDDTWKGTGYNEAQNLIWSNFPDPSDRLLRLDPGVDQYLDVFMIYESTGIIHPLLVANRIPVVASDAFHEGGIFRFDISVTGDNNAHASLSLKVTTTDKWYKPIIEVVSEEKLYALH